MKSETNAFRSSITPNSGVRSAAFEWALEKNFWPFECHEIQAHRAVCPT